MRNKLGTLIPAAALIAAVALTGCSAEPQADTGLKVVATTSIIGDVVSNVAGSQAAVEVLMPIGASPHDFVPSARQVAALYEADLVVANGLDLEEGLGDVLAAAEADGVNVLSLGAQLTPLPVTDGQGVDPHVWMDPGRMKTATVAIAKALFMIDGSPAWGAHADVYSDALDGAHIQIERRLGDIPAERRTLVTNHESLGYFADRYGFEIVGTVVPGGSSLGDPSSAQLAELVETIEREQVRAIFAETTEPDALAHAVAAEAGFTVAVVELYTGSLGEPGTGADTLIGMLILDAERIAAALGS